MLKINRKAGNNRVKIIVLTDQNRTLSLPIQRQTLYPLTQLTGLALEIQIDFTSKHSECLRSSPQTAAH